MKLQQNKNYSKIDSFFKNFSEYYQKIPSLLESPSDPSRIKSGSMNYSSPRASSSILPLADNSTIIKLKAKSELIKRFFNHVKSMFKKEFKRCDKWAEKKLSWLKSYGHDRDRILSKRWSAVDSIDFELITLNSILFYDRSKHFDFFTSAAAGDTSDFNLIGFIRESIAILTGKVKTTSQKLSFSTRNHK